MPKYCPECGTELKEGDKFCSSCGATVEHIEEAEVGKRFCPKCGVELVEGVEFCSSCGARISEISMEMAGTGARFGSFTIDLIIIFVIEFVIDFVIGAVFFRDFISAFVIAFLLSLLVEAGYFTYFFGNGQTPGMKVAKIKLCGTDGTYPISYGKGFIRWVGMYISLLVLCLGFLWILIDENKQGWHDKMADTYVVVE